MPNNTKPVIGIIGAGRLGVAVATLATKLGYTVFIANSRGPETLTLTLQVLTPGTNAGSIKKVVSTSDIIVLAIPLNQYSSLDPTLFDGKIVIDAMNYWSPTEGYIEEFASADSSSSVVIQNYFRGAKVVKTLSHIAYNELSDHSLPRGNKARRAMAYAGNDKASKATVAEFIDTLGFDAVDLGTLNDGKNFQPDTPLFNARHNERDMRSLAGIRHRSNKK